eukprot:9548344-Karenia_brevis.AAC.1
MIQTVDLQLKRSLRSTAGEKAQMQARDKLDRIFASLGELGVGEVQTSRDGQRVFRKLHITHRSSNSLRWIRSNRVPALQFGIGKPTCIHVDVEAVPKEEGAGPNSRTRKHPWTEERARDAVGEKGAESMYGSDGHSVDDRFKTVLNRKVLPTDLTATSQGRDIMNALLTMSDPVK